MVSSTSFLPSTSIIVSSSQAYRKAIIIPTAVLTLKWQNEGRCSDAPDHGGRSAETPCAGHGARLLSLAQSVCRKRVARATRRPEDRDGFFQNACLYWFRARYPFRPASRRAVQANGLLPKHEFPHTISGDMANNSKNFAFICQAEKTLSPFP